MHSTRHASCSALCTACLSSQNMIANTNLLFINEPRQMHCRIHEAVPQHLCDISYHELGFLNEGFTGAYDLLFPVAYIGHLVQLFHSNASQLYVSLEHEYFCREIRVRTP